MRSKNVGKGIVDGVNGVDKKILILYSARELEKAQKMADEEERDGKRFAGQSIDKDGKEYSLASECAILLAKNREKGVKSNRKHNKREDNRSIRKRKWWVEKTPDNELSGLKYHPANFSQAAAAAGGTHNSRYHVFCCPEMGVGTLAMRRIPCACDACNTMIRQEWVNGKSPEEQPRFRTVTDCKYRSILGTRNEWDIVRLQQDTRLGDADDGEEGLAEAFCSVTVTIAESIEIGNVGAIVTTGKREKEGFYLVKFTSTSYTD